MAITDADGNNNEPVVDQIQFTYAGNIDLTNTLSEIIEPVTINGPGASNLNVRRDPSLPGSTNFAHFIVNPEAGAVVTIRGLTISGARAAVSPAAGLQKTGAGTLILDSVVFNDNRTDLSAGALWYQTGATLIQNSTLSGNQGGDGGAILGTGGTASLVNSTIFGNSVTGFGGGINVADPAKMQILSSTVAHNEADLDGNGGDGGGLYHNGTAEFKIANTLLALNTLGDGDGDIQCSGDPYTSLGYNLRTDADAIQAGTPGCNGFGATGDFVNATPLIAGAPATNGGPTPNVALQTGSPAINAGNPATPGGGFPACPATDQRGLFRGGVAGPCDIGAYEFNASSSPPAIGGGTPTPPATAATIPSIDVGAAIKHCKKKFPKGPKRKKCIKRAKRRAQA